MFQIALLSLGLGPLTCVTACHSTWHFREAIPCQAMPLTSPPRPSCSPFADETAMRGSGCPSGSTTLLATRAIVLVAGGPDHRL